MGGAVRNVVDAVEDVVGGAADIVEDVVIDPVSDALASFEDSVRDVVTPVFDGFNEVIEDPYVQLIASIVDPTPGKIASTTLRTYAKANSGQEISASDLAQLGISSVTALGDVPVNPDTAKLVKSAATIADGGDVQDVLIDNFGQEAFERVAPQLRETARTALGDDVYSLVQDNIDPIKAGFRIAQGEDASAVLADTYGDQIVGLLGSDDPSVNALGYAGLKTAVGLDQGLDQDDALLAGAEEYYQRGGQLPDAGQIASLAGIEDVDFDYNKLVGNLGLDFSGLSGMGYDLRGLGDLGIDLNKINLTTPDIFDSGLNLGEVADLGLDLSGVDFSGYSTADLGDYNLKQLQDLGVDLTQLNLRPEFQMIGLAELMEGDVPGGVPLTEGEELATLTPDLDFLNEGDEIPLPRQILSKPV